MARRRHQSCPVKRTHTKGGKNDQWYIRYRLDHVTEGGSLEYKEAPPKYLGYCKAVGIRVAESRRDEFLKTINSPGLVIPAQIKFGVVLAKYLGNCSVRDSSLRQYQSTADAHIGPRWGETRMCDIRQIDLEHWLLQISRSRGKQSFGTIKAVFSEAWNAAIRWGYTKDANPISILPKGFGRPKPSVRMTMPTEAEFARFIAAVRQPWQLAAQIMMGTGMRVSEVLCLRWQDFDADSLKVEWTVTQKGERLPVTKTEGSARTIPVGHIRGLVRRPASARPSDWIFEPAYFACNRAVTDAAKAVGIYQKGFATHMFRRGHNTLFRRLASVEMAMEQLGQTSAATNNIYFYPGAPELEARASVARRVTDLVMGETKTVQ